MTQIPYAYSNGRLTVEVELQNAADVFLVDSNNFRRYKSGNRFEYFGGHYARTPVQITVNGTGYWYLIVEGSRHYRYKFY
ncbi:DUF1883 domain-containing protein [Bacillus aerophilus]|uniref:DUF1883 domain-containing protein n=1 Tax=Bacillus safensis TaxID=561879 RepID=UPI002E1F0D91|nr:DUF1883 domain-containing protein [Bacillus aerophilus]MED1520204.1 DUF1883 domain-containing protein [Bacillus safensis]